MKDADVQALRAAAQALQSRRIVDLFADDAERVARFSRSAPHLHLDASKERIDPAALDALFALATRTDALGFLRAMANGAIVNATEGRQALHTALRGRAPNMDIAATIEATRARLDAFCEAMAGAIRAGHITGLVHIGIGGSDLGPRLVVDALHQWRRPALDVRFAANIDGADITDALAGLDPARTLVVVVSKTFTTLETLANANAARAWLQDGPGALPINQRLIAVSAAPDKAITWGAAAENVFPFWDFVGGRYSVWSAVGVSAQIALQDGVFAAFRAGAAAMDAHALDAPAAENAPLFAALLQTWRRVAWDAHSYALIPYARRLRLLPGFLQQLEMESNGKRVDVNGAPLPACAAAVTWGDVGANAQHSFFQQLHQGFHAIPVDFLITAQTEGPASMRAGLLGNALAQSEALLVGRTQDIALASLRQANHPQAEQLAAHKTFPGDRGSMMIGLERIDPQSLGALLAFYEHRTVLQAALMGVNPFDQWGVELGKELATIIARELEGGPAQAHDPSTQFWIRRLSQPS